MKTKLHLILMAIMALSMVSCNGPIGYAIHVAKTDTHMRSYNTNEDADDFFVLTRWSSVANGVVGLMVIPNQSFPK